MRHGRGGGRALGARGQQNGGAAQGPPGGEGDETAAQLARRLRIAAEETDLAAIFTIHGFCARVLREHALEAGQGFDAPELMASDTALREAIAADLWRSHGVEPDAADDLLSLWSGGPPALAGDLSPRMARGAAALLAARGYVADASQMAAAGALQALYAKLLAFKVKRGSTLNRLLAPPEPTNIRLCKQYSQCVVAIPSFSGWPGLR